MEVRVLFRATEKSNNLSEESLRLLLFHPINFAANTTLLDERPEEIVVLRPAGRNMNLRFFKICCKIMAIGNVVMAILAISSMDGHLQMFYGNVQTNSILKMYHYGFWTFVLTMGIAYWELSKNLFQLRVIALIGAIGKLSLVSFWLNMVLTGQTRPMIWLGIVYDLFFGIVLAISYLKTDPKKAENLPRIL